MKSSEIGFEDMKNYEQRLNQEWVQVLINLRMKHSNLFTRKRNSAADAWKNILQEMIDLGAPSYISLNKIKKKWMNLIARYKHLKFSSNAETITWPYFEQLDRAYSRNPNIVELRKASSKKGSDSDESTISDYTKYMLKKQKFTSTLIQLRHTYKHLFTGKKFAAQKGWFVIQNLLPNGENYTIEQISKCWQNLVQRYKSLLENEQDHSKITWVHFKNMHEIMKKKPEVDAPEITIKTEMSSPEKTTNKIEDENPCRKNTIRLILTNPKLESKCAHKSLESDLDFNGKAGNNQEEQKRKITISKEENKNEQDKKLINFNPTMQNSKKINLQLLKCENKRKPTSLDDVLTYMAKRDEKAEEFRAEVKVCLRKILQLLEK